VNRLTNKDGWVDPKKGQYELLSSPAAAVIHGSRTTASGQYTDDVFFEFSDSSDPLTPPCSFTAYSQSRALSFYDMSTNFCNIANLYRDQGGAEFSAGRLNCLFQDMSKCG
jgi:hypothetical protein